MQYRIHKRNNIKTSIIGIDFSNKVSKDGMVSSFNYDIILKNVFDSNINLISIPDNETKLVSNLETLERTKGIHFLKSLLVGFIQVPLDYENDFIVRDKIIDDRFEDLENRVSKLISENNLRKIEFLTLMYPKNLHFQSRKLEEYVLNLKKSGLISSFGIRCEFLADALDIGSKINYIDHIEVEMDINTSSEMVSAIFKLTNRKNIALFCIVNDFSTFADKNMKISSNNISNLIQEGNENFMANLRSNLKEKDKFYINLLLRRLSDLNFQNLLINVKNFNEKMDIHYFPSLTTHEEESIQNSFEPKMYESPKRSKDLSINSSN